MKGLKRVVLGSAVGGLLGAAAFFAVDGLITGRAEAAPTYLTCEDTTSTKDGSPYRKWTRQIFFDLDTNKVTVDGKEHQLTVAPSELKIFSLNNVPGNVVSYTFTINRSNLAYEHEYHFISSKLKFESTGNCQIAKAPAGNKI